MYWTTGGFKSDIACAMLGIYTSAAGLQINIVAAVGYCNAASGCSAFHAAGKLAYIKAAATSRELLFAF